jgi:endoglucanase
MVFLVFVGLLSCSLPVDASENKCEIWPAWNSFRTKFVSDEGRVVDRSLPQHVTTSEGQAYALMFALIANDRASFDLILRWTENNLASGDLTSQLPAWNWGKRPEGGWGVIDSNAATDADLWIAYALNEAGRLWKTPKYSALAELLAARILREEAAEIPGLGLALLPGPKGFHPDDVTWRFNPSYLPIQIVRRFAVIYPDSGWKKIADTSLAIIVNSAPSGFVQEWTDYEAGKGFLVDSSAAPPGAGFNAIRVYLWSGMLDSRDPAFPVLLKKLAPMVHHVASNGTLLREINTPGGTIRESASAGFSSALLPFLKASNHSASLHQQKQRIVALAPLERTDNYYDQVLTLFGLGWLDGLYKFDRNGVFKPRWTCAKS